MKHQRENFVLFIAVIALVLSVIVTFVPYKAYGQSGNKQHISTSCEHLLNGEKWSCNDCNAGSSICYDHTCSECYSGGGPIQ
jgi:hypothetical protein